LVIFLHLLVSCVTVSSDKRSDKEKASDYVSLGAEYFQHGRLEPALQYLKKAVQYDKKSYPANALLALVYEQLGRYDEAGEYFRRAIDLVDTDSRDFGSIHNNYAAFLCSRGKVSDAASHFRIAFEHSLYATPELALENGGLCFIRHDDLESAEGYFREALKRNGNLPRSLVSMAEISLKGEHFLAARAFMQRFLAIQTRPGAADLLLAVRIERAMGDDVSARKFGQTLRQQYPTSEEVKQLAELY